MTIWREAWFVKDLGSNAMTSAEAGASTSPGKQSENERRKLSNTESIWIVSGLTKNKFRNTRIFADRQANTTQTHTQTQTRTEHPMTLSVTPVCVLCTLVVGGRDYCVYLMTIWREAWFQ